MSRVCVVAGAGPGVGLAVASRFAAEGFAVALLARRQAALDEMAAGIVASGGIARGYAVDLTDAAALRATLDRVAAEMGRPGALIYNASGVFNPQKIAAVDPAAFAEQLGLCVTGAFVAAQAVLPGMAAAGGGVVIFTGSAVALRPEGGGSTLALTAGKAGLRALAHAMSREAAGLGVHLGMVTIDGAVKPGTAFDPDRIAESFWAFHAEPPDAWSVELTFRGA